MENFDYSSSIIQSKRKMFHTEMRTKRNSLLFFSKRKKVLNANFSTNEVENIENTSFNLILKDLLNSNHNNYNLEKLLNKILNYFNPPLINSEIINSLYNNNENEFIIFLLKLLKINDESLENIKILTSYILGNILIFSSKNQILNLIKNYDFIKIILQGIEISSHTLADNLFQICAFFIDINEESRLITFENEIVKTIFIFISKNSLTENLIKNILWSITMLCQGPPYPDYKHVNNILDLVLNLLDIDNKSTLLDVCYILAHLSHEDSYSVEKIDKILKTDALKKIELFSSDFNERELNRFVVDFFGNLSFGNSKQILYILVNGGINCIFNFLRNSDGIIREKAAYCLSNFIVDSEESANLIIKNNEIISNIIDKAKVFSFYNNQIQIECIFCLGNILKAGNLDQTSAFLKEYNKKYLLIIKNFFFIIKGILAF